MGTRFIASREARARESYKKRITQVGSADTEISGSYSGKPMRVIRNRWVEDWSRRGDDILRFPDQMAVSAGEGVEEGEFDTDRMCMPCGQGAGAIDDVPTRAEIIDRVMEQAGETISRLARID